ncbi:MAG TPA: ATP-binding protein [Streptosporangiaceae bacterium]|nr:ATP-binding protein [Streptosporangiaceae bacterium]
MLRSTCEELLTLGDQQERLIEALLTLASSQRGVDQWEPVEHTGGHGLGLAIVQAIATAHGATLAAHARPEGGLDIKVSFPASGLNPVNPQPPTPATAPNADHEPSASRSPATRERPQGKP